MNKATGKCVQKRIQFCILFSAILMLWTLSAFAQQPQFGGYLQLDKRLRQNNGEPQIADFYNRFRLEMTAPLNEKLSVLSSLDVRFYDLPRVSSLSSLEDISAEYPTELSVWEAFVDVYGFLHKNIDLRIGKQRIAWGTADRLNPTDNLNPDDFSDLVNFAEKVPTWAVKANVYLGTFTFTSVWLPSLTPVLMPRGGTSLFIDLADYSYQDNLHLPARTPDNSMYAFKLSGEIYNWDFSLSYFSGYDDIPVLNQITLEPTPGNPFHARIDLGFPRMQVVGADMATELFGAGLWGEFGYFLPEKIMTKTTIGALSSSSVFLDDAPFLKFTLGGDYTFPGGFYLNAQWMHGFFTERGNEKLHDYFILLLEKELLQNRIKISLGGGLEVVQWQGLGDNYGYGLFPEIVYQSIDNLELAAGLFSVDGKPTSLFGSWQDAGQVYMRAKVIF